MMLLHEGEEVAGLSLLQHTQSPNHVSLQEGLQLGESALQQRVNLDTKWHISRVRPRWGGTSNHVQSPNSL